MKKTKCFLPFILFLLSGCVNMGDKIPMQPSEIWYNDTYSIFFGRRSFDEHFKGELEVNSNTIKITVTIPMGGSIDVRHSTNNEFLGEIIFSGSYSYDADEDQIIMTVRPKDDKENIFGGKNVTLRFSHEIP